VSGVGFRKILQETDLKQAIEEQWWKKSCFSISAEQNKLFLIRLETKWRTGKKGKAKS